MRNLTARSSAPRQAGLRFLLAAALLGVTALTLGPSARADIGPHESMQFTFEFQIPAIPIIEGQLVQCDDATCANGEPYPYQFACEGNSCSSYAIMPYARHQKLAITFSDRVRESNVFTKKAFYANYVVTVREGNLEVKETLSFGGFFTSFFNPFQTLAFLPAAALTLFAELIVAAIWRRRANVRVRLGWVALANLISLPIVWFAFPMIRLDAITIILLAEAFAFVFEAAFLYLTHKKKGLRFRGAAALSLWMNIGSVGLGVLLAVAAILLLQGGGQG